MSDDIESLLMQRGLVEDAVRINSCFGWKNCHSAYCIKCMSRRVYHQREHLLATVPALLARHPSYQLWFITGAAADNHDVKTHAWSAVSGMRRLLNHRRLKSRVVAHFSVLEVAHKYGRVHPCAHVHTLVITKPLDKGKYRISRKDWISIWEEACPLHRKRDPTPVRRSQRGRKRKTHPSLAAYLVPRNEVQQLKVIRYCTKWACPRRVTRNYRRMLCPNPEVFFERVEALRGVPRFFGELHKK